MALCGHFRPDPIRIRSRLPNMTPVEFYHSMLLLHASISCCCRKQVLKRMTLTQQQIGDSNADEVNKELMLIAMEHTRKRIEAAASALSISPGKLWPDL